MSEDAIEKLTPTLEARVALLEAHIISLELALKRAFGERWMDQVKASDDNG